MNENHSLWTIKATKSTERHFPWKLFISERLPPHTLEIKCRIKPRESFRGQWLLLLSLRRLRVLFVSSTFTCLMHRKINKITSHLTSWALRAQQKTIQSRDECEERIAGNRVKEQLYSTRDDALVINSFLLFTFSEWISSSEDDDNFLMVS